MKKAACIALGAALLALFGCANTKAHDNFKARLKNSVGMDIGAMMRYRAQLGETLQIIGLPNGNQEYRYTMQYKTKWVRYGPCTTIYEVDSITKKIIRADFEGTEHDCIAPMAKGAAHIAGNTGKKGARFDLWFAGLRDDQ